MAKWQKKEKRTADAGRTQARAFFLPSFINVIPPSAVGLVRTVVSISHCGCDDPGSIPGLDKAFCFLLLFTKITTVLWLLVGLVLAVQYHTYCWLGWVSLSHR